VHPDELLRTGFHRAADADAVTVDLVVADRRLRLTVAGARLAEVVLGPLRHLASPPDGVPDGRIQAWDAAETSVDLPVVTSAHVTGPASGGRGARVVLRYDDGPVLIGFDPADRTVTVAVGDARALPPWDRAAPVRVPLHLLLQGPELGLSHAAAVAPPGGPGLLLTGPGGSGKSTTSVAAALAGWLVAGEDYVVADLRDESVRAWSLYTTAKLDDAALRLLPGAEHAVAGAAEHQGHGAPKVVVDLPRLRIDLPTPCLTIAALVVVVPDGPESPRPLAAAAAVRALAPTSVLQLPGDRDGLRRAAAIARRVPCYELGRGAHPTTVVERLGDLAAAT
jgi:hypothetical protein